MSLFLSIWSPKAKSLRKREARVPKPSLRNVFVFFHREGQEKNKKKNEKSEKTW